MSLFMTKKQQLCRRDMNSDINLLPSPAKVLLNMNKVFFVVVVDFTMSCENPWRQITSCFVTLKQQQKKNPLARSLRVSVLLICFVSCRHTVIHFSLRVEAAELHVRVDTMKWFIDSAEAEVIEMHRGAWRVVVGGGGAAANNGRRGNILPAPRPWRQSIKPYDSIRRCPVTLIYQLQTHRLWRSGWEPSDCVDLWTLCCRFATVSVWVMSGCRLWLWCCAEIRPQLEPWYSSAEAWHQYPGFRSLG